MVATGKLRSLGANSCCSRVTVYGHVSEYHLTFGGGATSCCLIDPVLTKQLPQ